MFYDRVYFGKELVKAIIKKKKNKGGTKSKRKRESKKKMGEGSRGEERRTMEYCTKYERRGR
jgi:hypothetical protein